MFLIKSILAATDFSTSANNAVCRAAFLATEHGARLRIVHVVPRRPWPLHQWLSPTRDTGSLVADAQMRLQRLAAGLSERFGLKADTEVLTGEPVEALTLALVDADLLVVGDGRRRPLTRLLPGQTAPRLIASCRRPVLVVKPWAVGAYRRALMPIDFTPASDAAALVAAALTRDIELQVFHALDPIGEIVLRETDVSESVIRACCAHEESAVLARMRRTMRRLGLAGRRLSFVFDRGAPAKAALRQAQVFGADVLVAAGHHRGRWATSVRGSILRLLSGAPCDLLVVPGWVADPRPQQALAPWRPVVPSAGIGGAGATASVSAPGWSWTRAQVPGFGAVGRRMP